MRLLDPHSSSPLDSSLMIPTPTTTLTAMEAIMVMAMEAITHQVSSVSRLHRRSLDSSSRAAAVIAAQ